MTDSITLAENDLEPDRDLRNQLSGNALFLLAFYVVATVLYGIVRTVPSVRAWGEGVSFEREGLLGVMLINAVPALTAIVALIWLRRRHPFASLARALRLNDRRTFVVFVFGVFASLVFAVLNFWPWDWTRPGSNFPQLALILLNAKQYAAIALSALIIIVVVPVLEEYAFRVGLLQWIRRRSGSVTMAVVLNSVLFAVAHLGTLNRVSFWDVRRAIGAGILGLAASSLTIRDGGGIGRAAALHSARNAIDFALLLYGAASASS